MTNINWLNISDDKISIFSRKIIDEIERRKRLTSNLFIENKDKWVNLSTNQINQNSSIKYEQMIAALEYRQLTGQSWENDAYLKSVAFKEKQYFEKVYKVNEHKAEVPACVIVPTYNNVAGHRYFWNLESILQQEYSNYRVVIIDDASTDGTGELIGTYLKWKNVSSSQVKLIHNSVKREALENIYYAVHKYCELGEIVYLVDGDDELIGRQVFKLFNSQYHQKGSYAIYSNYISLNYNYRFKLGIAESYPQ